MKILASDFDGTLFIEGTISNESKEAIKRFQQAGNKFGLCTGRTFKGVDMYSEGIHYDFYILCTGGVVLDENKKDICRYGYAVELADEIAEYACDKADVICLIDGYTYHYQQTKEISSRDKIVNSYTELGLNQIESLSILCDSEDIAFTIKEHINKTYGEICSAHQNITAVDSVPKGCSKATGLSALQDHYQLNPEDVYVIGDSYNDVVMFEAAKHSFSFPYAPISVQEKSEEIVADVAEAIERLLTK
jgi:Cof subfamily protein (haloacid dehalogenase superfamily)